MCIKFFFKPGHSSMKTTEWITAPLVSIPYVMVKLKCGDDAFKMGRDLPKTIYILEEHDPAESLNMCNQWKSSIDVQELKDLTIQWTFVYEILIDDLSMTLWHGCKICSISSVTRPEEISCCSCRVFTPNPKKVIAGHESWVHGYDPETKAQVHASDLGLLVQRKKKSW